MPEEIRVIRKGQKKQDLYARFNCPNCNAYLEATMKQGQRNSDPVHHESWTSFKCPCCNNTINVYDEEFKHKDRYVIPTAESYYNK